MDGVNRRRYHNLVLKPFNTERETNNVFICYKQKCKYPNTSIVTGMDSHDASTLEDDNYNTPLYYDAGRNYTKDELKYKLILSSDASCVLSIPEKNNQRSSIVFVLFCPQDTEYDQQPVFLFDNVNARLFVDISSLYIHFDPVCQEHVDNNDNDYYRDVKILVVHTLPEEYNVVFDSIAGNGNFLATRVVYILYSTERGRIDEICSNRPYYERNLIERTIMRLRQSVSRYRNYESDKAQLTKQIQMWETRLDELQASPLLIRLDTVEFSVVDCEKVYDIRPQRVQSSQNLIRSIAKLRKTIKTFEFPMNETGVRMVDDINHILDQNQDTDSVDSESD